MNATNVGTVGKSTRGVLSDVRLCILIGVWVVALAGWMGYLTWYANAPGADSTAPGAWPTDSTLAMNREGPTLLMFIHPRCPCTSASLEELSRIIARCRRKAAYYCVFVRPQGVPNSWEKDSLWDEASGIPYVKRLVDEGGKEAKRFGAKTSGTVQLFGADGELEFSGGITGARNHAGDNVGANAVIEWISTGESASRSSFVFGCSLF